MTGFVDLGGWSMQEGLFLSYILPPPHNVYMTLSSSFLWAHNSVWPRLVYIQLSTFFNESAHRVIQSISWDVSDSEDFFFCFGPTTNIWPTTFFHNKNISVLLSAHPERFSVSRVQDFFKALLHPIAPPTLQKKTAARGSGVQPFRVGRRQCWLVLSTLTAQNQKPCYDAMDTDV